MKEQPVNSGKRFAATKYLTGEHRTGPLRHWGLFSVGCGLLILICLVGAASRFSSWWGQQEEQLATLVATDDMIAEFGDGGGPIPITPESALSVGSSSAVGNIHISVIGTGEPTDFESPRLLPEEYTFWAVEFVLENVSNDQIAYVNPIVDSQIQYIIGSDYSRDLGFATQDPNLWQGAIELAPQSQIQGVLIYEVPSGTDLFWVYRKATKYVVFKVR